MKRLFDILASFLGLFFISPVLFVCMFLIWMQDFHSPFYIAPRVGKDRKIFKMVKLRSMVTGADKCGVDSTAAEDSRITGIGRFVRKFKLDEFTQLWNVLFGEMSFVGPRPQVERAVNVYTDEERKLLAVRPGITDFSSIVFSDEGDILAGSENPDLKYNQVIRPWKSRLGLFYIQHSAFWLDIQIILLTLVAILSRPRALRGIQYLLKRFGAESKLIEVAGRNEPLRPYPPPGMGKIREER